MYCYFYEIEQVIVHVLRLFSHVVEVTEHRRRRCIGRGAREGARQGARQGGGEAQEQEDEAQRALLARRARATTQAQEEEGQER